MKNFLKKSVAASVFMTLLCAGNAVQAQSGNGAYVERTDRPHCIGNSLLGLPFTDCLMMTQTVFMVQPSGRSRAVWEGTLSTLQTPTVRKTWEATWKEPFRNVNYSFTSIAVAMPDGSIKLSLNGSAEQ